MPIVYQSALSQNYADYSLMVHAEKPHYVHPDTQIAKYYNCSHNRNSARKMALSSDADYFLFVDDDTLLPSNAIPSLIAEDKDIIGGWYKMINGDKWIAGRNKKGHLVRFTTPKKEVIEVDMIGMGCALFSRRALINLEFEHGQDRQVLDEKGEFMNMGECLALGLLAQSKGYTLFMHGDVICEHLSR